MDHLKGGSKDNNVWATLFETKKILENSNIYIDDTTTITPAQILSKCRRLKATKGLDLVVVDHLQLIYPDVRTSENRQQEVTEISRGLKVMAKELGVPVLALSQLSRGVTQRKGRPMLSDLRESGSIEQDADVVMFIYRPDKTATAQEIASGAVEKDVAEIIIEKNRSGERGSAKLLFKGEYSKFVNIANYQLEAPGEYKPHEPIPSNLEPAYEEYDDASTYSEGDIPPEDDGDAAF
jgi:replicative DNA helicase